MRAVHREPDDGQQGAARVVAEGWLVRTAGSGSFVADRRTESPLLAIRNIADEIAERGSEYSGRVIRLQRQAADEKVAVQLGLRVGAPIFHSLIVHQADGEPLQLEERFVDAERLPEYGEQDFASQTPNRYLMEVCPSPRWSTWWRRCCRAPAKPACCRYGSTPLPVAASAYWSDGYLVSYARLLSPGSRYKLSSKTSLS